MKTSRIVFASVLGISLLSTGQANAQCFSGQCGLGRPRLHLGFHFKQRFASQVHYSVRYHAHGTGFYVPLGSPPAVGSCSGGACSTPQSPPVPSKQTPVAPTKSEPQASVPDPYGFLAWLNGQRALYQLPAVTFDQELCDWAYQNNLKQIQYRVVMHGVVAPGAGQTADFGPFTSVQTRARWFDSPGHRAILLSSSARKVGIDGRVGPNGLIAWTVNIK